MVRRATVRFRKAVNAGRAEFRVGTIENLSCAAASFDKVCTVNTIYFWESLDAGFVEIRRVLRPGGLAVIGFLPKEHMDRMGMPSDIFTTRSSDEVSTAIERAGFSQVRIERRAASTAWNVVLATR